MRSYRIKMLCTSSWLLDGVLYLLGFEVQAVYIQDGTKVRPGLTSQLPNIVIRQVMNALEIHISHKCKALLSHSVCYACHCQYMPVASTPSPSGNLYGLHTRKNAPPLVLDYGACRLHHMSGATPHSVPLNICGLSRYKIHISIVLEFHIAFQD